MDDKFAHVYKHAVRVARNVNVDPTMPRVAGRQIHRCNASADNPEQYYQRNVAVPLINHIKAELDEQFSGNEFSGEISIELLFFPFTSPSARSFLCSTELLRLFFPPNRSVCVGVKPPLSRTVSAV